MAGPWFQFLQNTDHITEAELLQLVLRYLHSRGYEEAVQALTPIAELRQVSADDKIVSLDALCWQV